MLTCTLYGTGFLPLPAPLPLSFIVGEPVSTPPPGPDGFAVEADVERRVVAAVGALGLHRAPKRRLPTNVAFLGWIKEATRR